MEGHTPVSALIHAATMVTAGVLLIIKLSAVFEVLPVQTLILLYVGAITSVLAAVVGFCQRDIKKIVAYSTMSQLGYMVMITGLCHYEQSFIHLINHVFLKLYSLSPVVFKFIHLVMNKISKKWGMWGLLILKTSDLLSVL